MKNVLVFFTDQQRWDTTGVHGNPLGLTPNFDRLATRGVHVANSFTCQPVCAPARATLQTGLYPNTNGVFRNGIPLDREVPTLARQFAEAGYETGYIGKWHLYRDECPGPVPAEHRAGYQYWLAANLLEFTSDAYETTLYDKENQPHTYDGYRADAIGSAAIDFVSRDRDNPFFLFLSFLEPHHQNSRDDYPAPEGYRERYEDGWVPADLAALEGNWPEHLAGYYGMVRRLDEVLGRLVDALAARGILDDTIILFTSDHGCHFKTRNREYKRSCHDASIRVPTLLAGAGLHGRVEQLVSHIDLPPTLLAAAGLPTPSHMQGRSILPFVDGSTTEPDDVLVQISESETGRALRTRRWKYGVTAPDANPWDSPSADAYVETYLYDLESDPNELTNLVQEPILADVRQQLRARLLERIVEAGEVKPVIAAARA
ncbi:sulfatase-like hydrolase/transferase [Amycolatopsis acidicola]|uniref:Sulfatase-like hydrolase/transferase n=1 Tax=Amycolatopsis acidicola TaxID=2596893 RepID=A0A5N0USL6_9PSEU|nr:sulfatase-like hydrolase/transferase [Amycolatopsis acidicola]